MHLYYVCLYLEQKINGKSYHASLKTRKLQKLSPVKLCLFTVVSILLCSTAGLLGNTFGTIAIFDLL